VYSKHALNGRWRFFCSTMLTHGFHTAVRLSGFQKHRCYSALANDPRLKEYMLSLIGEALGTINLTLGDIIREMHDLSKDDATSDTLRYQIKKDLVSMIKEADTQAINGLVSRVPKTLKPAIEEAVLSD